MTPNVGDGIFGPDRYALGVVVEDKRFNFAHELTEAEWVRLDQAILAVNRLQPPFHYKLIERNFLQLKDVHQFVTIAISLGRQFASGVQQLLGESVMEQCLKPVDRVPGLGRASGRTFPVIE